MNMKIQSVGFKADKKLEDFINQKLTKLNKFDSNISDYNVTLNIENSDPKANKVVDVKINVPGNELFASKQSNSFEAAVELVTDALKTQILKNKEK
ncbi:ribosome-associated translation inhibitor RaiA [Ancylomarina sp. 16SWW S1-10-2]|uniref:ribosome hibernation-promoting factor, HPF/YfiA family n=1 Tax=Ancylomarina sp. 16SWW S1-10-2 TaxID=2499681 RepID=UPI0012AE1972|nr:ribosome-associated translation inhibitor RaiA [Ancylomarina sp. 16SWW S1-10-2]MRT93393.1 ribosome-associated translation inhibitor RaiA [Ancylomarina sp. 16SWW S1-10-2]